MFDVSMELGPYFQREKQRQFVLTNDWMFNLSSLVLSCVLNGLLK